MNDTTTTSAPVKRNIWVRGLMMVLMAVAFQLASTLLVVVALIQFVLSLLTDAPNARLLNFGQHLGRYLRQIAGFVSFAEEEVPFPFSDWPSD